MRLFLLGLLIPAACAFGAVNGTVFNGTVDKPQAGVSLTLVQPSASGMQTLATVTSGADGKFAINQEVPPGPALVQANYQGATYTVILPPGGPTTDLTVNVFNSSTNLTAAKVGQRMVVIEPSASGIKLTETVMMENETKTTFQDPNAGSAQFFLPDAAQGKVSVTINAAGGMPIQRPAEKTKQAGVYKIVYPVRPGETRFDIGYSLPPSDTFSGRVVRAGEATKLITPAAVTLTGQGIQDLGQEPQTQAHIYNVTGDKYEVKIAGLGSLRDPGTTAKADDDTGAPQVEVGQARLYTRLYWVLGLTFAILAFGGFLLYRREEA